LLSVVAQLESDAASATGADVNRLRALVAMLGGRAEAIR